MAHADHCDSATTSNPDHTNTCISFDNYSDAWQDCGSHSDAAPELCPDAFQGSFHVDNSHTDGTHTDCHNDIAHSDTTHSDAHSDVSFVDNHYDTHSDTHSDSHSNTYGADSHIHNCNAAWYVDYTASEGKVFSSCAYAFYNSCGYGACNFEDCGGVGYDHFDWYVYQLHYNNYTDVAFVDNHSDTHSDTHSDSHSNTDFVNTHSDVAFVDVAFADHCDHVDHNAG